MFSELLDKSYPPQYEDSDVRVYMSVAELIEIEKGLKRLEQLNELAELARIVSLTLSVIPE